MRKFFTSVVLATALVVGMLPAQPASAASIQSYNWAGRREYQSQGTFSDSYSHLTVPNLIAGECGGHATETQRYEWIGFGGVYGPLMQAGLRTVNPGDNKMQAWAEETSKSLNYDYQQAPPTGQDYAFAGDDVYIHITWTETYPTGYFNATVQDVTRGWTWGIPGGFYALAAYHDGHTTEFISERPQIDPDGTLAPLTPDGNTVWSGEVANGANAGDWTTDAYYMRSKIYQHTMMTAALNGTNGSTDIYAYCN